MELKAVDTPGGGVKLSAIPVGVRHTHPVREGNWKCRVCGRGTHEIVWHWVGEPVKYRAEGLCDDCFVWASLIGATR